MIIEYKNKPVKVPDVLMVGAAKSGTTSLYKHLSAHKGIYFPENKKEPFYFSFGGKRPEFEDQNFLQHLVWDTKEYLGLYANAGEDQLLVDGSTSYLYHADRCIRNIRELYGKAAENIRIIVILRNPVERAWSHYNYLLRNGKEDLPFYEAIRPGIIQFRKNIRWGYDYLAYGEYHRQIQAYQRHFKHLYICLFEDLQRPQLLLNDLFAFLGLDPVEVNTDLKANPSGVPRNKTMVHLLLRNKMLKSGVNVLPSGIKQKLLNRRDKVLERFLTRKRLDPKIRAQLNAHYEEGIRELSVLLNRDLSHWLL